MEITIDELRALLSARRDVVVVVDVRSLEEYAEGHVDGALHVPGAELEQRLAELRDAAVVVTVCTKGGGRSQGAATRLRELGLRDVRYLAGGTNAWRGVASKLAPPH